MVLTQISQRPGIFLRGSCLDHHLVSKLLLISHVVHSLCSNPSLCNKEMFLQIGERRKVSHYLDGDV